ncbi:MAG: hypothetical protein PHQ86_07640 [Dehalococcoidales bacterium]|nr:hypothetical protein [Dehalococcoidales bacterium]
MDATTKIPVKNTSNNELLISLPDIRFKRKWPAGATFKIDLSILQEAIYDGGFMTLMNKGILFIDSKEARVELGLEEEDAKEPTIKVYTGAQILKLLKASPTDEFVAALDSMSNEQRLMVADIAIEQKTTDINKAEAIKKACGVDVVKAIQLKAQNEEPNKE